MTNSFRRRRSAGPGANRTSARPPQRKVHRNPRGLFLGAVLGGIAGYFAGRAVGSAGYGMILGALVGSALLYRLNPGPWNND